MRRPHEKGVLVSFKDLLKRILPPPVHAFNREVARILDTVDQGRRETDALRELIAAQGNSLDQLRRQLDAERARRLQWESQARDEWRAQQQAALDKALEGQAKTLAALSQSLEQSAAGLQKQTDALAEAFAAGREQMATRQQADALNKRAEILADTAEKARSQAADSARHASEAVWAQIFNNTISESLWLKDKTFSPGRWAVGYPYLYVMYRVLNETRPKRILELGLGQSTRMIAQYAAAFQDVEHIVVEQDKTWTEFFAQNTSLSPRTKIVHLPVVETNYLDDDRTLVYQDFEELCEGKKFDLVSSDGPAHSQSHKYRRVELVKLIPDHLADSFCIILDDFDVQECKNMWAVAKETFSRLNIPYGEGIYRGDKDVSMFTSINQKFLCSM